MSEPGPPATPETTHRNVVRTPPVLDRDGRPVQTAPLPNRSAAATPPVHTDADPSTVETEHKGPSAKTAPSGAPIINAVAVVGLVVACLGIVVGLVMGNEVLGIILGFSGATMAILSAIMAAGDSRTDMAIPLWSAITASIIAVVLLVSGLLESEGIDNPDEASERLSETLTAPSNRDPEGDATVTTDTFSEDDTMADDEPNEMLDGDADLGDSDESDPIGYPVEPNDGPNDD